MAEQAERGVTDWLQVARDAVERADREAARAALQRAEQQAARELSGDGEPDGFAEWAVAVSWHELDPGGGHEQRLLAAALARAWDMRSCLALAHVWGSLAVPAGERDAWQELVRCRAWQLARSCTDFLWLAGCGDDDARAALVQARRLARSDDEQAQVAQSWRERLREEPPAGAPPTHFTPAELVRVQPGQFGWDHDAGALFEWLRPRVGNDQLANIAAADYGYQADLHLAALREIRNDRRVPVPLPWQPLEVLSLAHWAEGEDVDHVARSFCCVVLCLGEFTTQPSGAGGIASTLAILIESCLELGDEATRRAMGLFAALAAWNHPVHPEHAFALLALLVAGLRLDPRDERLPRVAQRLLDLFDSLAQQRVSLCEPARMLSPKQSLRADLWQRLVRDARAAFPPGPPDTALARWFACMLAD